MSGGFFRGTSADQDTRFSNKQAKLMKSQKFAPELENLVDMTKVKMDIMKPWIAKRVTELIGFEDEVLINFIYTLLEGKAVNGKNLQIQLTGFMERNTPKFMKELWGLLICAQQNASGVPQEFLDAKEEETKKKKAETDRVASEIRMKREKQELDQMKSKMDVNGETPGEKHLVKHDREQPTDEKEMHKRNGSRGRSRFSHSSDSSSRSPSPRRKRSESPHKSSNPRSYSNERRRSRSNSGAPKSRSRSVSSERRRRSPPRRSITPRRRHYMRRSPSPPRHRSSRHRSPTPTRYRVRPSWRYQSRSPLRRRSRSPMRRRSRTPIRRSPVRRRSRSPVRRRSRSPIRRRSRSPVQRRSPSLVRGRSPSPVRRRSPSPARRQSPSPVISRSLSPVRRRSLSPVRRGSSSSRSTSPVRQLSPPPVRRSSPSPYGRRPPPQHRRSSVPEKRRRSPSTPPRRSSVHRRDRSLTPVPRTSPSVRSSSSPSPTRRHSLRRGSPRRIARSPSQRVRSREEYSPDRRASPAELLSKSRTVLKSAESKPVVLRSPQRDVLDPKNLHRKERHSPPSMDTSRSGNRRSTSPHGSPYTKRDRKSHPENLGSLSKAVESKSRHDETGTRVDDKDNFSRREFGDPKRSSSGKVSPTSVRRKDSIDSAEVHGIADVTKAKPTELSRSEKQPDRLDRKEHSERQGLSTIHEEADVSKKGREQSDSYKVTKKKFEKNGAMDSTPIKIDDPAIKGKEKRKHRKSDDYSSEDSHVERREAKKRKKEEKKLKKEERRRRREERRRKKEEKSKLKSVDPSSSSSDIERDRSEDDSIRRRDSRRNTQDTESQQKKLEIELREKALESLRARRGIGN